MKTFSIEQFAADRRKAQDKYTALLLREVTAALESRDFDRVIAQATKIFTDSYRTDTSEALNKVALNNFVRDIEAALGKSTKDSDPTATALMLSLAALNSSAIAAADADPHPLELEWVGMEDSKERPTHLAANGQTQAPGNEFTVGDSKMPYPGYTEAPIEEWINCRCVLRPVHPVESQATASLLASLRAMESEGSIEISEELFADAVERGIAVKVGEREDGATLYDLQPDLEDLRAQLQEPLTDEQRDDELEVHLSLVADSSGDHSGDTSMVVVALPHADDPVHGMGDEQKHVTLAYMGDFQGDPAAVHKAAQDAAAQVGPSFPARVSGPAQLGPDKANVLLMEAPEIQTMRDSLTANPDVAAALQTGDAHPHFVPHMTMDYAEMPSGADGVESVNFDRVAVWAGGQQTEYPMGTEAGEPAEDPAEESTETPDEEVAEDAAEVPPVAAPVAANEPLPDDAYGIPVHGVLAPEGVQSGDGRGFMPGSLSHRPLPLPGTWQEFTADGHDAAAVVFMIEKIAMLGNEQHFSGHLRTTDAADKFLGLMVDFGGRYGLSVDADSAVGEYNEADDVTWFSEARTSGAGSVNIPAFPEAYVAIGPHPILDAEGAPEDMTDDAPAMVAGGAFLQKAVQQFLDLAPGTTEDGPGWLTNPVDTDRLRDYWVRGEGAAKIGWGVPGDFNRCRVNLAEYVKPQYLNGYCANRHYDALGVWPGHELNTERIMQANNDSEQAPSVSLTAAAGWAAPSEWFEEPVEAKNGPMGVVITPEGRTYGFIATWGECHIGLPGVCTSPPNSPSEYAYFKTGLVPTREGGFAEVGQLTIGGGHADQRLGYRGAVAHYDNTCSVWADVNVGENEHGIWFAGSVRPGITEDMIYAARASGRLSGDWRDVHGALELSGALSVNVPGFPIPKVSFAAQGERQTALVAAGIIPLETETESTGPRASASVSFTNEALEEFASKLYEILEQREIIKDLTTSLEKDD